MTIPSVGPVLFWNGPFSQWHPSSFNVDGQDYRTAEHYMMAGKATTFDDPAALSAVHSTVHPRDVKAIGRQIKGYNEEVWKKVRYQIVCRGTYEKFRQNPELLDILLLTRDQEIVEASPYDAIWGVGLSEEGAARWYKEWVSMTARAPADKDWPGLNLLGKALMAAREMLRPR